MRKAIQAMVRVMAGSQRIDSRDIAVGIAIQVIEVFGIRTIDDHRLMSAVLRKGVKFHQSSG